MRAARSQARAETSRPLRSVAVAPAARRRDRQLLRGVRRNDVYSLTGAGQTKTISIARGASQFFPGPVQNDGPLAAEFKLKGTGAAPGYTVTYITHANGANVTAAMRMGLPDREPRAGPELRAEDDREADCDRPASATFTITASSTAGTQPDLVKGISARPRDFPGTMLAWHGSCSGSPAASPPTRPASSCDCSSRPGTTCCRC